MEKSEYVEIYKINMIICGVHKKEEYNKCIVVKREREQGRESGVEWKRKDERD